MKEKIKVIMCPVEREPYMAEMENSLEAFQAAVGGHIECVGVTTDCVMICNEEGRPLHLPENNAVSWMMPYGICGDVVLCGADGPEFDDIPETGRDMLLRACKRMWQLEAQRNG